MTYAPTANRKARPKIEVKQGKFSKGYISYLAESIAPNDALTDMLNMDVVQDVRLRPRPSLVRYGADFVGTCIGIGQFEKQVVGALQPEHWEISMQVLGGIGKIYVRKDGNTWTLVGGSYDGAAWVNFCQANNKVFINNGVDNMSYYEISAGTLTNYTALATPSAPAPVKTGLAANTFTYYYRVTAENASGETARSPSASIQVAKQRDSWAGGTTELVTLTITTVPGALRYNIYVGDQNGEERYIATTNATTYVDDGTALINPVRRAPLTDSTDGPIGTFMWNKNGQLFLVGDIENPSYLWYSGTGEDAGNWSPFSGGGYVAIDYGGATVPIAVLSYRDGKGTPAMTVLSKGAAGGGKLNHVSFNSTTLGDTTIVFPEVYEANGQSGAYAARAVVEANNNLYYLTGDAVKSTGTKTNLVNILSTDDVSTAILPDVQNLNLNALSNAAAVEYQNRIYFAVPNGSDENNEIWVLDLSRNGLWILRWTIPAMHLWKYEDNSGVTHLCALVNNVALEFTRNLATQDDGQAFRTRAASGGLVWDETGQSMGAIQTQRFKFLHPSGEINTNAFGIGEDGPTGSLANETFTQSVTYTGYNDILYNEYEYNTESSVVQTVTQSVGPVILDIDETVNQLDWEITTEQANCDYTLASVLTEGKLIEGAYYGD